MCRCSGLCSQSEIDEHRAENEHRMDSYRAVMEALGHDSSKYVLPLLPDSSDFVEIAVVALRQLVGDLPEECLPGDECAVPGACANAESCFDTPYGPKRCSGCPPGKAPHPTGGDCTLDIDECCSNPCLHDGECFDSSSGRIPAVPDDAYTCVCRDGWEGENCATDVDECTAPGVPRCTNGAACLSSNVTDTEGAEPHPSNLIAIGEYECVCVAGYSGTLCEVDVNECASGPCDNRGSCTDSTTDADVAIDAWNCTCAAGFEGESCSMDIDECASEPCLNGGVCDQPAPDLFGCECTASDEFFAAHFEGELCETELPVDLTWFILGIVSAVILLFACGMACLYKRHKDNTVIFRVETLDREGATGGEIVVEMRMKTWNTMYEVAQELQRREGIQLREQRLFFDPGDHTAKSTGEECLNTMPDSKQTIRKVGIVTGSVVTLLQVWTLNCREEGTRGDTGKFVLPCVERHWRVQTVKLKAQDVSGIVSSTMTLIAPGGTPLSDEMGLTSYPSVKNGCTLTMRGPRPVDRPEPPPPPPEPEHTADSVATVRRPHPSPTASTLLLTLTRASACEQMAGMFSQGFVPGTHLSDLQERAVVGSRAAPGSRA